MVCKLSGIFSRIFFDFCLDAFKKILSREGVRGLYRGLPAQLVGITPEKAIKLTTNDMIRYHFTNKQTGEIKIIHEMIAGALAGTFEITNC